MLWLKLTKNRVDPIFTGFFYWFGF